MGRFRVYPIVSFDDVLSDRQVSGGQIATTVRWCRPEGDIATSDSVAYKPSFIRGSTSIARRLTGAQKSSRVPLWNGLWLRPVPIDQALDIARGVDG